MKNFFKRTKDVVEYILGSEYNSVQQNVELRDYTSRLNTVLNSPRFRTNYNISKHSLVATPVVRLTDEAYQLELKTKSDISNYTKIRREVIQSLIVHGTVIVHQFAPDKYEVIPLHLTSNYFAQGREITKFSYNFEGHNIEIDENFHIFTTIRDNSVYFGTSLMPSIEEEILLMIAHTQERTSDSMNNSRLGMSIITPARVSPDFEEKLKRTMAYLSKPESKYTPVTFPNGTQIVYPQNTVLRSMSPDDIELVERIVCNLLGYPYQFLARTQSQLGQGEQRTLRQLLATTINKYQQIEAQIVETLYDIKKEDIVFTNYAVDTPADVMGAAATLVSSGVITPAEAKVKYLGYDETQLTPEDNIRTITPGAQVVGSQAIDTDEDPRVKSHIPSFALKIEQKARKFYKKYGNSPEQAFFVADLTVSDDEKAFFKKCLNTYEEQNVQYLNHEDISKILTP